MFGSKLIATMPLSDFFQETVPKFNAFELPADPRFLSPFFSFAESEIKIVRAYQERYHFRLTLHAPFFDVRLGALDPEERSLAVSKVASAMRIASEMEIGLVTFHPSTLEPDAPEKYDQNCRFEEESLAELISLARPLGLTLLIENMPNLPEYHSKTRDGARMQELFWLFPEPELGMTLDIGHALQAGVNPESLLKTGRVRHFHFHENDRCLDRHFAIRNNLDWWGRLIKKIAAGMPDAVAILEMNQLNEQLESRENLIRFIASTTGGKPPAGSRRPLSTETKRRPQ